MTLYRFPQWWTILLGLLSWLALPSWLNAQVDIEAAKKEGKVIIYAASLPQTIKAISEPFERKYGIKVEQWRASSTAILDRALNEWRAGRPAFDVIESNKGPQLILKKEGVFAMYMPPSALKFPRHFLEEDSLVTPWRFNPISILYNTDLVKSEDLPRNFVDLFQTKWRGKIALPDPSRHTTTAEFLVNVDKYGMKWQEFAKRLAQQQPHLVESFVPIVTTVIRGEAAVGITYLKYVGQFKGPIDYVRLDKYLADINYLGVNRKAPHPNAGRIYTEYLCSPEGQKAMADTGDFVLSPQASPAIQGAEQITQRTLFMDEPTAEEFMKLRDEFRQIFFK